MNQMPQEDEIDLFELIEMLWEGKWLVCAFIALAVAIGFGYTQLAKPKYEVSVPYLVNLYPVSSQQICGGNVDCIEGEVSKRLMLLLGYGWSKARNGADLSMTTETPANVEHYVDEFQQYNQTITSDILDEANAEMTLIQTELNDALLSTERVADNILNAKRVIQSINSGETAISFGTPSITKFSPKVGLILALSVVLGGMIGVFYILYTNAIRKRKEQMATA